MKNLTVFAKFHQKNTLFFLFLALIPVLSACSHKSDFLLSVPDFTSAELMESASSGTRFFYFSADQKGAIRNFFEKEGDSSLMLTITPLKVHSSNLEGSDSLSFGFFYDSARKLEESQTLPVVTDYLQKYKGASFALAFCFGKENGVPEGFFIILLLPFVY